MRKLVFICCIISSVTGKAADLPEQDSLIHTGKDSLIRQLTSTRLVPEKEKAEYVSQFTQYGFGNLFSKFSYNPSLPYSNQVNPKTEWFMQDYLKRHEKNLTELKNYGLPYFHLIDNVLTQYGLPRELKYLAVIESHLKTSATSPVGAAGPWQFMPATARQYGLKVNGNYDERRDYLKSTHAAARLLLDLFNELQDWLLVIAAYNGGEQRVTQAISKSGSRDFWILQYRLPEESRNHVKKFIATHYIMEGSGASEYDNRSSFRNPNMAGYLGGRNITEAELCQTETRTISGKFAASIIALRLDMDIREFNRYNPGMDAQMLKEGQYDLMLPEEKMKIFLEKKYSILNECVQAILHADEIPPVKTASPEKKQKKSL